MANLQVQSADFSVTKTKAFEDAKKMQAVVNDDCAKAGQEGPPYRLQELIGKGSFGRVYTAKDLKSGKVVAVKIIDIEGSDTANPKFADTYSEFMKEVNALKLLSDGQAKNVNLVLDALPVGHSMWMVTEYCAGGSVATLMKPTAPGGLNEKWIIPILREVAVAIYWVHKAGIIHRDIKCANVLVTETGQVQLCDFGVAGVIETKFDKRSTCVGTPHWMAPELFDSGASYGTEVDIWAFGSMVFEIASGLPPNVMAGVVGFDELGDYLKSHTPPRLEGDQYSDDLKDLVAFCLVENPAQRPPIEAIQQHPYIFNTEQAYPTSDLANLVRAYKLWEAQGGIRKSLFFPGGAMGPSEYESTALASDEWNFSTTVDFDRSVLEQTDAQDFYDVYGANADFGFHDETSRPAKQQKSRRRPPPQLPALKAPLEKVFDPNTISNYDENSRLYYQKPVPPPASDLPLRDDTRDSSLRESLIDLDGALPGGDFSIFADMDTIKAAPARAADDYQFDDQVDSNRAPSSDPADMNNRRATQEWKFPSMAPPASANPEMSHFTFNEEPAPRMAPFPGARPPMIHPATEPVLPSHQYGELMVPRGADNRSSVSSLIDLDESLDIADFTRPSTANSETASVSGSETGGAANPFELERYPSLYAPTFSISRAREPSIYVSDDSDYSVALSKPMDAFSLNGSGTSVSASTSNSFNGDSAHSRDSSYASYAASDYVDSEYLPIRQSQFSYEDQPEQKPDEEESDLPPVPNPPSVMVMQGRGGRDDVREEMMRMLSSFGDHLAHAGAHVSAMPIRRAGRREEESDRE